MGCPYCSAAAQGRCATTSAGRFITECTSCGRVVEERQTQPHHLFHLRAQDSPLCLVTSDLPTLPIPTITPTAAPAVTQSNTTDEEEDPFEPTGFITAFSTWSLEPYPVFAQSSVSFAGHLAELERVLETTSSSSSSGPSVVVDNLRAYLQIIDVASILGLDYDISDHAFELFRDCSSATCLRNRSVEALATAALVQAIREAQEPRTLQEISLAANLPQKEIGKYIKILGEALQLSQPLNSNSISVHMPRFCNLLQLNKSAQELATHIGEVVINKCFCTRRNPISISAAAIYLACQLEDKRKTQAEICKVTGLTEVTLRKVYKELLENWDDLLPSNYTPAVPPEKAFPTATITSGRSTTPRADVVENTSSEKDKQPEVKPIRPFEIIDSESKDILSGTPWRPQFPSVTPAMTTGEKNQNASSQEMDIDIPSYSREVIEKRLDADSKAAVTSTRTNPISAPPVSGLNPMSQPLWPPVSSGTSQTLTFRQAPNVPSNIVDFRGSPSKNESKVGHHRRGGNA